MKSLIVVSGLVLSAWAAPQSQVTFGANDKSKTSCGLVNGEERNVGDTWTDDCNNCVCRETGIATCTKRFCGNIPVLKNPNEAATSCGIVNGEERNVGDTWTDDCNSCICRETGISTCTKLFCGTIPVLRNPNEPVTSCGIVNGEERNVGDTWANDCNSCVCRETGISTCTKLFCGPNIPILRNPNEAVASCGIVNGEERNVGDTWTDDCNNCICRETGVATCTQRACAGGDRPGINFAAVCKNAINGEDRLEGESWTAADGCNTCKCLKSGITGCTKKLCLNAPIISPPRDIPCLGCPQESEVDDDITAAAAHATASLSGLADSGCGGIKLVKVENAKKQVVAGTNFVLTLRLETREGQGCADKTEKICENIVVFKPLPFRCQSDDGCLELTRQTDISCKPVKPAVCKNAINGEDRLEGENWTAADGCNTCRCLKSGFPGCTKKFCLDKTLITTSRPVRGCPGCPIESVIDDDITAAAAHATASLSGISDSGCGGIKLVKVENAKKQVVAGTNFVLTLRLETREGQGCADKTEKICENIVVFKPLPFRCQSDDGCLELTRQTDISCKPVKPAVCKNAINGEDRLEGENWTAADGCNTCRCLKSGIPGCTKKLCLDKPLITTSRPLSCPGCPIESVIDEEIFSAAVHATASLAGVNTVSGCGGINLVNVENARKQIVAGTNYFLTLRLQTRGGQGCANKIEKICENIVVFKPLPFQCQSQDGCLELTRQPGISCTEVQSSRDQLQSASSVLSHSKGGRQTSSISQCHGEGKENCQTVNINNNVLDNLSVGDQVTLLPGLNVDLTLKQPPTQGSSSTSFVFTVGQFGEAILTRGNNRSSMFGSIKPATGNVDYSIENCGPGCNVIYQRDSAFFNQFKD